MLLQIKVPHAVNIKYFSSFQLYQYYTDVFFFDFVGAPKDTSLYQKEKYHIRKRLYSHRLGLHNGCVTHVLVIYSWFLETLASSL